MENVVTKNLWLISDLLEDGDSHSSFRESSRGGQEARTAANFDVKTWGRCTHGRPRPAWRQWRNDAWSNKLSNAQSAPAATQLQQV